MKGRIRRTGEEEWAVRYEEVDEDDRHGRSVKEMREWSHMARRRRRVQGVSMGRFGVGTLGVQMYLVLIVVIVFSEFMVVVVEGKRPHIIMSVPDDMGYFDVGYNNHKIMSPTLDFLANNGIKLNRHYMHRFCSPSRSMFMSGLHPFRHGQQTDINLNPITTSPCAIQEDITFFPEVLQNAGYKTHMVGKWHLGHYHRRFTPTSRGFDTYIGFYAGDTPHMTSEGTDTLYTTIFATDKCSCTSSDPQSSAMLTCGSKNYCVTQNQLVNETREDGIRMVNPQLIDAYDYADDLLADEASRIIRAHDPDVPFFLYAAWITPHSPTQAPEYYQTRNDQLFKPSVNWGRCEDRLRYKYAGMITGLDEAQLKIKEALEDNNMWQDTIFIFFSDNGGHDNSFRKKSSATCDSHGPKLIKSGRNWPLRGGKFTFWEGGVRTLGFVYSANPDFIPVERRGTTWDGLISGVDWVKTILDMAQVVPPSTSSEFGAFAMDSISFWDQLVAGTESGRADIPVQVFGYANRYVLIYKDPVSGDLFKLIAGYPGYIRDWGWFHGNSEIIGSDPGDTVQIPEELQTSDPEYDANPYQNGQSYPKCINNPCLYKISSDPSELDDLYQDATYADIVNTMEVRLQAYRDGERPFVGSGLCYPGMTGMDDAARTAEYHDPFAIRIAELCEGFVPWYGDNNQKLADSETSCPVTMPFNPQWTRPATPYPTTPLPSKSPTKSPTTRGPTKSPSKSPSESPTLLPTRHPSRSPSKGPTSAPTRTPSNAPSKAPTLIPTKTPTLPQPSASPTVFPTTLAGGEVICANINRISKKKNRVNSCAKRTDVCYSYNTRCLFLDECTSYNVMPMPAREAYCKGRPICIFSGGLCLAPNTPYPTLAPTLPQPTAAPTLHPVFPMTGLDQCRNANNIKSKSKMKKACKKLGHVCAQVSNYCLFKGECSTYNWYSISVRESFCTSQKHCTYTGNLCINTVEPTPSPTDLPTVNPTRNPTRSPTRAPSKGPTTSPTRNPTRSPTNAPTKNPSVSPTLSPSKSPSKSPTKGPTSNPTRSPTKGPSTSPTWAPSGGPSAAPSKHPTNNPTLSPSKNPTNNPTLSPSKNPTNNPTLSPSKNPTNNPTLSPSKNPTNNPTLSPSKNPTNNPTLSPSP